MLTSYAVAHGFAAVSLRYFNVAGAAFGLGERHATETHLIPIALQVAAGQRESLTVFGDDYPTPDGTCIRDYVHVADLADAHLLALPAPAAGEHRIYNLGNGTGFSVQEVVDAVREVTGHPVPVEVGERRAGDPAQLVASSDRIRADLGWTPQHTDLAGIVRDAWEISRARLSQPGVASVRLPSSSAGSGGGPTSSRAIRRPSSSRTAIVRPSTSMVSPTSGSRPSSAST